jgi:hypothetical protein
LGLWGFDTRANDSQEKKEKKKRKKERDRQRMLERMGGRRVEAENGKY